MDQNAAFLLTAALLVAGAVRPQSISKGSVCCCREAIVAHTFPDGTDINDVEWDNDKLRVYKINTKDQEYGNAENDDDIKPGQKEPGVKFNFGAQHACVIIGGRSLAGGQIKLKEELPKGPCDSRSVLHIEKVQENGKVQIKAKSCVYDKNQDAEVCGVWAASLKAADKVAIEVCEASINLDNTVYIAAPYCE